MNATLYHKNYEKILVPLDGSENSRRALIEAITLSKHTKSSVTGLYVIKSEESDKPFVDMLQPLSNIEEKGYETKRLSEADHLMKDLKELCGSNGIEFQGIASMGTPSHKIVQYAEKNNFDLVIMGMRGKGHLDEMLLGSVSYYVLHKSKVPVLIVK